MSPATGSLNPNDFPLEPNRKEPTEAVLPQAACCCNTENATRKLRPITSAREIGCGSASLLVVWIGMIGVVSHLPVQPPNLPINTS